MYNVLHPKKPALHPNVVQKKYLTTLHSTPSSAAKPRRLRWSRQKHTTPSSQTKSEPFSWSPYREHLPLLVLGMVGLTALLWLMTHFSPSSLQNFPWPNSYAIVIFLVAWTSFFLSSYILMNTRRSTLFTVVITFLFLFSILH